MKPSSMLFLLSLVLCHLSFSFAQTSKMSVDGKPQKSSDEIVGKRDSNGKFCAAIQAVSDMDGFKYQSYNGVVAVDDQPGRDMVYLSPNERVLEIFKSGYEPLKLILSEYGIQLKERDVWQIKISGEDKMNQLPVVIITRPEGGRVFIDGKDKGVAEKHTLSRGTHNIRLIKQGYEPIIKTIQVDKNNTLFKYNLKEIEDVPLQISSVPSGATVYIDNVKFGTTPLSDFYPSGKYPIRIEQDWYVTYDDFIDIKAPQTQKEFTLRKDFGSLTVTSAPQSGLDIFVNGQAINSQTPKTIKRLRPGTYRVKAKSQYYETAEQTIEIKRGHRQSIQLSSENNFATLNINTLPKAKIYLNGKLITQLKDIRLEPAIVRLRAEMPPKGKAVEKRVVLRKDDNITIEIKPQITTGSIQIAVIPFEADIELTGDAGEYYIAKKSHNFKGIPIGKYILKISLDGYKTFNKVLKLEANKILKERIVLEEGKDVTDGFVFVKGGTFKMGSKKGYNNELPEHWVTVGDFYMSKYEVTQEQWKTIMGSNPSSRKGDNLPVENVSWNGIQQFIDGLNRFTKMNFRLPTEAEWEYAARGGNKSHGYTYAGSNNIDRVAWYKNNSEDKTHPVGQKQPNELGLFDMSGNVMEWCGDLYGDYSNLAQVNPISNNSGVNYVTRGGSWFYNKIRSRVAFRMQIGPKSAYNDHGFRLAYSNSTTLDASSPLIDEKKYLSDIDGNIYQIVKIGSQVWMAENLKVTRYRNGDPIPNVTSYSEWENLSSGAWCAYDNKQSNAKTYGLLYNWYAVNDRRNIAPAGWHVPTDKEWEQLEKYLGSDAGGKLKERGTAHWKSPNKGATNSSGFTALPGGDRSYNGIFYDVGSFGAWWSSTANGSNLAWSRGLSYGGSSVVRGYNPERKGFSVRLVRD